MSKLELLAPAKDLACGLDAVNCGADAVYIGAERFSARAAAANGVSDIGKLSDYAHRYRAKTYAALNTILSDKEIPHARKLAFNLWNAGIDGLIVQDMGLLEAGLPPVPLIASTQAHNVSPEKILFLEKTGFKRVILARELSLKEIRAIREKTSVELEFFVHGALCVCYSGQCYLSFALGGRSGNRGECAQPCRKLYSLKDAGGKTICAGKHLLSLKDLNLSRRLAQLASAGITSFKIEGRLKDRDYVRNIVSFYRRELDKLLTEKTRSRPSLGKSFPEFEPDPSKTFNRGYTEYFLDGTGAGVASPDPPKFAGEPLGPAGDVKNGSFRLKDAGLLRPGDGITYFDETGKLAGSLVNGVLKNRVSADNLKGLVNGAAVYRNLDSRFLRELERGGTRRKFALKLEFSERENGFTLKASDERGVSAEICRIGKKSPAQNPETALDTARKQLSRLGNSGHYLETLDLNLSKPYFIPVSVLNDLRREALAGLERAAAARPLRREEFKIVPNAYPYPEEKLDFTGNVLNSPATRFYRRHGVKEIEKAAEGGADLSGKPLMTLKFCLRRQFGLCKKGKEAPPLYLEDEEGRTFRLEFDCGRCVMKLFWENERNNKKRNS